MERIWNDIPNLPSLETPNTNLHGVMNLQESLARPFLYPNSNLNPPLLAPTTTNALFPASTNLVLFTPHPNSSSSSHQPSVSNVTCSGMQCSGGARKRTGFPRENEYQNNTDRRNQRLIRNRESAARSRDRKEAHTAELENEIKRLKTENAQLKQQQQLNEAAKALRKLTLSRSSSSPF